MSGWKSVSSDRYWEMLEILPPAVMTVSGFLVGEPADHRTCKVTGVERPRFSAFVKIGRSYYEAREPMTVPEFKALRVADVLDAVKETTA